LNKYYEIAIFTASVNGYALEFFNYLNSHTGNSISHCLTRDHCIEIHPGIYLKDLRIITNRKEKDIVLVDNNTYSFSVMVDNGVPIHNFTKDKNDRELEYLEKYLIEMAKCDDVRLFNRERLRLYDMVEMHNRMNTKVESEK
jgi:CTD small phosphatase-like protein 2